MSRDDLYGHYRQHYIPNNATLVVVGDVDVDDVLRRVEQQVRQHRRGAGRRAACTTVGAAAGRRAARRGRAAGHDRVSEGRVARAGRRPTRTSFRCWCSTRR